MANYKHGRLNFSKSVSILEYPNFLEIQTESFHEFFLLGSTPEKRKKEGLYSVFTDNFPISDSRENYLLEFIDYVLDPPKYSIQECVERGLTYSVSLKAKLRLSCNDEDNEDFETIEQEVFLGSIPAMTDRASFVINGSTVCADILKTNTVNRNNSNFFFILI